jgi:hypothetical protein
MPYLVVGSEIEYGSSIFDCGFLRFLIESGQHKARTDISMARDLKQIAKPQPVKPQAAKPQAAKPKADPKPPLKSPLPKSQPTKSLTPKSQSPKSRPTKSDLTQLQPAQTLPLGLYARPQSQNSAELAQFERQLLDELDPKTPFQRAVARNIASNEIEILVLRERQSLIFWDAAKRSMFELLCGKLADAEALELARAFACGESDATARIRAYGYDPEVALNSAYASASGITALITIQIERLERRRRQLYEDLARIKAVSSAQTGSMIADAELIEEQRDVG